MYSHTCVLRHVLYVCACSVCVCMCKCAHVHVCACAYLYVQMHVCVCVCAYACVHVAVIYTCVCQCISTLRVEIFTGIYFCESKKMHFAGMYFRKLILISLFYTDFDGISEKYTFHWYLISRNQQKLVPAKISTIKVCVLICCKPDDVGT